MFQFSILDLTIHCIFFTFLIIGVIGGNSESCDYISEDGRWTYNLSYYKQAFDYLKSDVSLSSLNRTYYYVPCKGFYQSKELFPSVCAESAVCIKYGSHIYWSGGSYHSPQKIDGDISSKGFTIIYTNGSSCPHRKDLKPTITVKLICHLPKNAAIDDENNGTVRETVDPNSAYSFISHVNDSDPCDVTLKVLSPLACPNNRDPDPKCHGLDYDSCLNVDGCYCHVCGGVCMAYYEYCERERVYMCNHNNIGSPRLAFHGLYFNICAISTLVALCACSVGCISRKKKKQIDENLKKKVYEDDSNEDNCEEMNNLFGLPRCVLSRYAQPTHSKMFDNVYTKVS